MRRRLSLLAGVAALGLTLAGCGGGGDSTASDTTNPKDATGKVGVFTWWADGSEKAGLDALVGVFNKDYPNLTFDNLAVAGGAGSQAKSVLAAQLKAGNPPDSFQAHAGAELQDYIDADQIEDLSGFYKDNDLTSQFPKDLIDRLTVDGKIYSVPSNIHRANVVWANVEVLKKAGLDPTKPATDLDGWFADMDKIKASGTIPLSVAGSWTQVQLFENILLSSLGSDGYNGLWDGKTDWKSAEVTTAIEAYKKALSYTNTDRDSLSDWAPATQLVQDGAAAYNVMGDWAEAKFEQDGDKSGVDYTYFATPGTQGVFDFLADSFTLPKGAPNPGGAKAWLTTIGSAEGQTAFNKVKGSIPANTTADTSDFSEYQQSAIKDFGQDKIVSSLAHGAAVPVAWLNDLSTAVSKFGGDQDVAGLQDSAASIAAKYAK
ncbi:glucose/mannose transport system substrate-binding protein [Arthrobacter stackebrandtii]|uniref:Probable sugar-binding periplasmic protein n=1 Tax=Arthrobacter stackebrandtii TaxID=272161 RepID=A0ABS4YSD3_9MICC|nr:ABC transporter substrate-binding protein [Arthrobacter stackebrandtii]MBP2411699.1 glucose/mannose transport system substrate-binding protein [Arthrobacter stackebrandtii]PYG99659.1 sugar ABC transporter substrate-binding protein [Arthrobacter stackebrandtii]